MASKRSHRPAFDASCIYIAARDLVISGRAVLAGATVAPPQVSPRRLRQMYELRLVNLALGSQPVVRPRPRAVGQTDHARPGADGQVQQQAAPKPIRRARAAA